MKAKPAIQRDVGLIVAAAGRGRRFGRERDKLLQPLNGTPVVCHCLRAFAVLIAPENSVLVVPPGKEESFRAALAAAGVSPGVVIIVGGRERQDSVICGLSALPEDATFVAVHDGARPHSTPDLLGSCIRSARQRGSGVAARRAADTLKIADSDGRVRLTPDRATLWAAETPQVFRRELLQDAYEYARARGIHVTDDAQAVELLGRAPVFLVEHSGFNGKITHPADLSDGQAT